MTFNEIFGLSLDDLYAGEIDDAVLSKALKDNDIPCYGYIVHESQPATKTRERENKKFMKIPNVCEKEDVKSMNLIQAIKRTGIKILKTPILVCNHFYKLFLVP